MADLNEKLGTMVEKKKWPKLQGKYLNGNEEEKTALAKACGKSNADESSNILITLLQDSSEAVQLEAVKSLGIIGNDHSTAQLQYLLNKLGPDKKEMTDAIHKAISNVKSKQ